MNLTPHSLLEQDLTYQHLLAAGMSHCRLEMTDQLETPATTETNESTRS